MARSKSGRRSPGRLKEAVATVGMIAMVAGGLAGAWLGWRLAGLGAAFIGLLLGGAAGFGIVYFLTNIIRQNSRFFTLLAALAVIALITWGLHAFGDWLGLNPR